MTNFYLSVIALPIIALVAGFVALVSWRARQESRAQEQYRKQFAQQQRMTQALQQLAIDERRVVVDFGEAMTQSLLTAVRDQANVEARMGDRTIKAQYRFPPRAGRTSVTMEPITQELTGEDERLALPAPVPDYVRYEDVRPHIPQGHALVGVSERGIETREDSIRALLWVVGGSGVGKTNSVSIRIDNDYERGHMFLGVDPHAFKSDSLTNALRAYQSRFLLPMAQRLEDINTVLDAFLAEFEMRKNGSSWQYPITIVIDEVGSMIADVDKDDKTEVDVARKLKEVARICGQESRGFEMYGIFISQDAAGLAWLRKRALMVLAHQVMMWSERILVCNNNTAIAREMDTWPKGRTLAYGLAFTEGLIVVQQPRFTPRRIVDANPVSFPQNGATGNAGNSVETASQASSLPSGNVSETGGLDAQKNIDTSVVGNDMRQIMMRMSRQPNTSLRKIAEAVGLTGRKYPLFQAVCKELGIDTKNTKGEAQ